MHLLYRSTGCKHGDHVYCQNNTGANGNKVPARCKFCKRKCWCFCHKGGIRGGLFRLWTG